MIVAIRLDLLVIFFLTITITPFFVRGNNGTLKIGQHGFVRIGKPFQVTCRMSNRDFIQQNAGFIFMIENEIVEIDAKDILVKTSKKIKANITVTEKLFNDLGRPGRYVIFKCFYKKDIPVNESLIKIGYTTHQPRIVSVTFNNWEYLEVIWEKQTNPYYRIRSFVEWKYSAKENFTRVSECDTNEGSTPKDFKNFLRYNCPIHEVDASESVDIRVYSKTWAEPEDTKEDLQRNIFLNSRVKPDAVKNFHNTPSIYNISLRWLSPKPEKSLIYEVSYKSHHNIPNVVNTTENDLRLTGLDPYTIYNVQIRCLPIEDSGFWSDAKAVTVKTLGTVPAVPARVTLGGWYVETVKGSVFDIIVYWQPIPEELARGNLTKYEVTAVDIKGLSPTIRRSVEPSRMSCLISDLDRASSYEVYVDGYTEAGAPARYAYLAVKEKKYRPSFPQNFTAIAINDTSVSLSWSITPSVEKKASNLTVYWCLGTQDLHCKGILQWETLPINTRNHILPFPEGTPCKEFLYGISMETKEPVPASSGMSMISQVYDISARCGPPEIEVKEEEYSSLTIILTYQSEVPCRGYIWGYRLHYCKKKGNTDECGDEKKTIEIQKSNASFYKLEHLEANVAYILTAESMTSAGPSLTESEKVESRTKQNEMLYLCFLLVLIPILIPIILYWRHYFNKKMIALPKPDKNMPITPVKEPDKDGDNEVKFVGPKPKTFRKKKRKEKVSLSSSSEDPGETQDEGIYSGSDFSSQSYGVPNSRVRLLKPGHFQMRQFSNGSDTSVFDSGDTIPYFDSGNSAVPVMILPGSGDSAYTGSGDTETSRGTGSASTNDYNASAESYVGGSSDYCGTTLNRTWSGNDLEKVEEEENYNYSKDEDGDDDYCPTVTNDHSTSKNYSEEDNTSESDQEEEEETLILPLPDMLDQSSQKLPPGSTSKDADDYAKVGIQSTNIRLLSVNTEDSGSSTADEEESDGYT